MTKDKPKTRGQLLRQILVFQFKLAMDGLRDLLLRPISIVAPIEGIHPKHPDPSRYFNRPLKLGHRSDQWINLFNTHTQYYDSSTADDFVREAESIMRSELEKSGVMPRVNRPVEKTENQPS